MISSFSIDMAYRRGDHVLQDILDNLKLHLAVEAERIHGYCQLVDDLQTEILSERQCHASINGEGSHEGSSGDSGNPEDVALETRSPDGRTSRASPDSTFRDIPLFRGIGSHDDIRRRLEIERRREYQDYLALQAARERSTSRRTPHETEPEQSPTVSDSRNQLIRSHSSMPIRRVLPRAFADQDHARKKQEGFARYRQELADQISLKKSIEEEVARKQAEEDEKWNRRIEDQRRKIKEEYEREKERLKRKSLSQPDLSVVGLNKSDRGTVPKKGTNKMRVRSPSYVQIKDIIRRHKTQTHTIEIDSYPCEAVPKRVTAKHPASAPSVSTPKKDDGKTLPVSRASKPLRTNEAVKPKTTSKAPLRSVVPSLHDVRRKMQDDHQKILVKMASLKFSGLP